MIVSTTLAGWLAAGSFVWAAPAPVTNFGLQPPARNGAVTVRPGDRIETIAKLYGISVAELAAMNHLHPPYHLNPGKRLLLPMPRAYTVGNFDTLFSISRMYGVPASRIADNNHLKPPYRLRRGQVLHIPERNEVAAQTQTVQSEASVAASPPAQTSVASNGHVKMLRKPGPSTFSTMVSRIAGGEKPHVEAMGTSPLLGAAAPPPPPAPIVSVSHRSGFIWPVKGQVISSYGPKDGGLYNDGINIAAPRGTPVLAAADGTVAYVGNTLQSYGNLVLIRHAGGMITAYAHLNSVLVKQGMIVRRGQPIGSVGSTGTVVHAQLHFEVRRGTDKLDPQEYLG